MHFNLLLPDQKKIILFKQVCYKYLHVHGSIFPLCCQHVQDIFAGISFCFLNCKLLGGRTQAHETVSTSGSPQPTCGSEFWAGFWDTAVDNGTVAMIMMRFKQPEHQSPQLQLEDVTKHASMGEMPEPSCQEQGWGGWGVISGCRGFEAHWQEPAFLSSFDRSEVSHQSRDICANRTKLGCLHSFRPSVSAYPGTR